jgi:hypothetical protein
VPVAERGATNATDRALPAITDPFATSTCDQRCTGTRASLLRDRTAAGLAEHADDKSNPRQIPRNDLVALTVASDRRESENGKAN